jgi:GNAT superfamily N-acetyltransferase
MSGMLRSPASSFDAFWVLEDSAQGIFGCIALQVVAAGSRIELKKCYVHRSRRGEGWGRRLVDAVKSWGRRSGCEEVELWTDTRFRLAHRAYSALGYRASGRTRELHDISRTTEYHYLKQLA